MFKHLLALVAAAAMTMAYGQNIMPNPSFEELDAQGSPKGWWLPGPHWHSSTEAAYEGKRSLLFDNSDEKLSTFVSGSVPCKPGHTYAYSAVFKAVTKPGAPADLKPSAKIFLEYTRNGKYSGGQYGCTLTSLNNEWTRIEGQATIPDNTQGVTVALVPSPRNSTLTRVWLDSVEVHEVKNGAFACLPTTDCYRDEAASGMVNVLVGRFPGISSIPEQAFKESECWLLQNGKVILTAKASSVQKDRVTYQFDSDKLAPGDYAMQCRLLNPDTKQTEVTENRFRKLAKAPNYKVYIDKKRRMIVDGKPFFPLGMYFMKATKENLAPYIDSDFNCLMPYLPPTDKEMLDYIHANNLKLIYSAANVSSRTNDKAKTKATHERGYQKLESFKHHPAIIAWYINDELPVAYVQDAIDYRRGCQDHDPDRPTWTVLCHPGDFMTFLPASDIHGSDPYPIPESTPRTAYTTAKRSFDAALGSKMLIQVPQAFSWARYWVKYGRTAEDIQKCPMPTYEQMDAMAWLNICGGANGLVFYSYFDLEERDKEAENLPAIPFRKSFGDIKKVASRIKQHEHVLLSDGDPEGYAVTSNPDDAVCFRAYGLNGETWILAVNSSEKQDSAFELTFNRPMALTGVSLSDLVITLSGTKVSASLKPLQVVFIRLK